MQLLTIGGRIIAVPQPQDHVRTRTPHPCVCALICLMKAGVLSLEHRAHRRTVGVAPFVLQAVYM